MTFTEDTIAGFRTRLENHPVYAAIGSLDDLRVFMQHHVYSVWDYMSLIKSLQGTVAPAAAPWLPGADTAVRRFVNELVMEEESDAVQLPGEHDTRYLSHFELYCNAMQEIGADAGPARAFVARVAESGIGAALAAASIPAASRCFMRRTFGFIDSGRPHVIAAAMAIGREHVIPVMFQALLDAMRVRERDAPQFHYYLARHVHLDGGSHGPLSLRLLNHLCDNDPELYAEAMAAAEAAVSARLVFWDEVCAVMQAARPPMRATGS
jgi:hypothetical protein